MTAVQVASTGLNMLCKLAANDGMKSSIWAAYRFLFAAAFMLPLAFQLERQSLAQNLYAKTVALISATFATSIANLIPVITFVLAISFRTCDMIHGLKPAMMMVILQIALPGINIFFKLAANDGMSLPVLVAYRFFLTTAMIVPLALYVDRKSRPKLTRRILLEAFLIALFGGSMANNLYAKSLVLTSSTFDSAILNGRV